MSRAKDPLTGLTYQQDHFAHLVAIDGLSQSDAYRKAYNPVNSSPDTIFQNASHLAANTMVAPRIAQLRAQLYTPAVDAQAELVGWLRAIATSELVRPTDKVAAIDKMAKILGLYKEREPQRPASITQIQVIVTGQGASTRVVEQASADESSSPEPSPDGSSS